MGSCDTNLRDFDSPQGCPTSYVFVRLECPIFKSGCINFYRIEAFVPLETLPEIAIRKVTLSLVIVFLIAV